MSIVFKFPLDLNKLDHLNRMVVEMPAFAGILTVQMQGDVPTIWARCKPGNKPTARVIEIIGTGMVLHEGRNHKYLGTFQMHGGSLVFHAFEVTA